MRRGGLVDVLRQLQDGRELELRVVGEDDEA